MSGVSGSVHETRIKEIEYFWGSDLLRKSLLVFSLAPSDSDQEFADFVVCKFPCFPVKHVLVIYTNVVDKISG